MKRLIRRVLCAAVIIAMFASSGTAGTWTHHQRNKDTAHEIAELMRARGYSEDHPVIMACQDWWKSEHEASQTVVEYTTMEQRTQYPVASAVWQLLREAGIDEIHAAALIGNAMAESGGHTLDLNLYQDVDGFYGIWAMSKLYFPEAVGKGAPGQIEVLLNTLESNIVAGGGSAETWWNITDVRVAAKYFSDYWERPAFWSEKRADNAAFALRYFTGE